MSYLLNARSRWLDIDQDLLFTCLWAKTQSRSITTKKEHGQYLAILNEQDWSIEELLYGLRNTIFLEGHSGEGSPILPSRVANQSAGFGSSCSLAELAIKQNSVMVNFYASSILCRPERETSTRQ